MTKPDGTDGAPLATIELPVEQEPKEEAKLTVADISDGSFSKEEIEAAKKHGLVVDDTEKKETKPEAKKTEENAVPPAPAKADEGKDDNGDSFKLDPDKEQQFQELFGENKTVHNLYQRMKKDRVKRQDAQAERDQVLIQKKALEQQNADLEAKIAAARNGATRTGDEDDLDLPGSDADEDGKEKPLTRSDLERIEKEKADKEAETSATQRARMEKVSERLDDQQEDAKVRYKDFDPVMDLAHDLMKNLETLVPDAREQQKVSAKIRICLNALGNADKFGVDQYNGADMAYEIGQMHPKYKPGGTDEKSDEGADLTPDKLNRIVTNANRRTSATLNGGASRRVVSVDNLTVEQLAKMPKDEFRKLRKTRPDVVERLLRQ